MGTKLMCT